MNLDYGGSEKGSGEQNITKEPPRPTPHIATYEGSNWYFAPYFVVGVRFSRWSVFEFCYSAAMQ
jgi:hypothetical protein